MHVVGTLAKTNIGRLGAQCLSEGFQRRYQLPFWDAQIWASARLNQIPTIFSQDFQSGVRLDGVQFVNPLEEGFQLKDWIDIQSE